MRIGTWSACPEYENRASRNFGGPMKPFAPFETPTPSVGMLNSPVSSLSLLFSSWKDAIAYVPAATSSN
jgi:hypothetical protein